MRENKFPLRKWKGYFELLVTWTLEFGLLTEEREIQTVPVTVDKAKDSSGLGKIQEHMLYFGRKKEICQYRFLAQTLRTWKTTQQRTQSYILQTK